MFQRSLILPRPGTETFFLWGPRQTGKTTLLRRHYAGGRWIDLLKSDEFRRYATRPELLRLELEADPDPARQIVIDEVQRVPALLNEGCPATRSGDTSASWRTRCWDGGSPPGESDASDG